jgi:hypothetical protein
LFLFLFFFVCFVLILYFFNQRFACECTIAHALIDSPCTMVFFVHRFQGKSKLHCDRELPLLISELFFLRALSVSNLYPLPMDANCRERRKSPVPLQGSCPTAVLKTIPTCARQCLQTCRKLFPRHPSAERWEFKV